MNIILCGFQSVGKTYFGKLVSQKLGRAFFDVDEQVLGRNNEKEGVAIRDFCLRVGEDEFRRQEAEVVLELSKKTDSVIALGGGSLTNTKSQEAIKKAGKIIYLYLPKEELYKRLVARPLPTYLANTEEAFDRLFVERHNVFAQLANDTIFLQANTNNQVLDKICANNK